jgi:hypothetical protein
MAKKTTKQLVKTNRSAVDLTIIGTVLGLVMALVGFLMVRDTSDPNMVGANSGAGLLAIFGLIIVAASVLVLAATVITTPVKKAKKR